MTPGEMAGRIEAADGPSRPLDAEIEQVMLEPKGVQTFLVDRGRQGDYWVEERGGEVRHAEPITASLDAAVAFVERALPGWRHGYQQEIDLSFFATLKRPRSEQWIGGQIAGQAATPAMALVAAALRALQDAQDGAK